jgi:hypothetical protein
MKEEKVLKVLPFSFYGGEIHSTIFTNKGVYLIKQIEEKKYSELTSHTYIPGENIMELLRKQDANKKIFKEKKRMKTMPIEEVHNRADEKIMYEDMEGKVVKEGSVAGYLEIFVPTGGRFIKHRVYEVEFPLDDFDRISKFLKSLGFFVKIRKGRSNGR